MVLEEPFDLLVNDSHQAKFIRRKVLIGEVCNFLVLRAHEEGEYPEGTCTHDHFRGDLI